MELCCVPLLAGLFVGVAYYYAHQRGYQRGQRDTVQKFVLMDLAAGIERAKQEDLNTFWHGTGEEGGFEGIGHLMPEDDEE